jgi:hypothetical protein
LIYLRRSGENTSSFEVESVLLNQGAPAHVAIHAVPIQLSEHDLKVIAVPQANKRSAAAEFFE